MGKIHLWKCKDMSVDLQHSHKSWSMMMYICHTSSDGSQVELTCKSRHNNKFQFSERPCLKKKSIESIAVIPMSTSSLLTDLRQGAHLYTYVHIHNHTLISRCIESTMKEWVYLQKWMRPYHVLLTGIGSKLRQETLRNQNYKLRQCFSQYGSRFAYRQYFDNFIVMKVCYDHHMNYKFK